MRIRVLAAVLAACATLSACGGGAQPNAVVPQPLPPAPTSTAAPPDGSVDLDGSPTVEKIKQRGKLLVGLRSDAPDMVRRVSAGEYQGFDVEVAGILAAGMGLDPRTQISYRWLPSDLRANAMTAGSVDVQLGGFDRGAPQFAGAGPYAVVGGPGAEVEHYVGFNPGDDAMGEELDRILDAAVADGRWQRAYDTALAPSGVRARPAP
ncbi:amino acid ABC transporter substrate-binding protein (PAAT family) [Saccharopolyspora erythraea NRRL 2338]|uniref:Solute-binding protein family 3/N-terminal domain-containing protein n=2 Tax=Saccharopolyspora erythraea TaxID=1836 RepID=A4FAI4_SACEN|nr:hypothetical protein [Saccharopolyspora erythraea]EQD82799.1 hypothetical protein N599_28705 [Saccharopolyspora erythraea D]PFG94847.1 amino acid ABC transporter substrate-binding protein (PAAT family) [Saccharopolyspora erythraea NRRL 2338]QRK91553.1 hypothetical protein JQX30_09280 [Saccharopolyspora erythraea]CAM01059.1 hypothetical protein SACE_1741 [Saccharopolyspora erythraea NRRL 2338]